MEAEIEVYASAGRDEALAFLDHAQAQGFALDLLGAMRPTREEAAALIEAVTRAFTAGLDQPVTLRDLCALGVGPRVATQVLREEHARWDVEPER